MASAGNDTIRADRNNAHVRAPKRKGSSANDFFDTGGKMRRPTQNISSAFGRSSCSNESDIRRQVQYSGHADSNTGTATGQHDGKGSDQLSRHGKKAAQRDIACTHDASDAVQSNSGAVPSEHGANTSAASQLRARLRGQPLLAVSAQTVRFTHLL